MAASKPLSYEGLKTVLQHLEANKRFQVTTCCRSIRNVDKIVPLKLESLKFDRSFKVNGTTYNLGAFRQYPIGADVPKFHHEENKEGGVGYDLDRFGVRESSNERILTPGDIFITDPFDMEEEDNERAIRYYLQALNSCESFFNRNPQRNIKLYKEEMSYYQVALQPHLNKRDNVLPEYKIMTQLTIQSASSMKIERFEKASKLHEAMKYLTSFLLGGRRQTVYVKHLSIGSGVSVIRLPVGLKLKVREIELDRYMETLGALESILDFDESPLEFLKTVKPLEELTHPIERTARKLSVLCSLKDNTSALAASKLTNREIRLKFYGVETNLYAVLCKNVLKDWIRNGREIGSRFWFAILGVSKAWVMNQLLETSKAVEGIKHEPSLIKVPMNSSSEIHIMYENRKKNVERGVSITVVRIDS